MLTCAYLVLQIVTVLSRNDGTGDERKSWRRPPIRWDLATLMGASVTAGDAIMDHVDIGSDLKDKAIMVLKDTMALIRVLRLGHRFRTDHRPRTDHHHHHWMGKLVISFPICQDRTYAQTLSSVVCRRHHGHEPSFPPPQFPPHHG